MIKTPQENLQYLDSNQYTLQLILGMQHVSMGHTPLFSAEDGDHGAGSDWIHYLMRLST